MTQVVVPIRPGERAVKNRLQLDLACDDVNSELAWLRSLGTTVLADQPSDRLIVLMDPEGNEFCLLR